MIAITRRLASKLRTVLRRAFGSRGPGPTLGITVASGTLSVRASAADVAVEYREPSTLPAEGYRLPFQFLEDCQGKSDEPVEIQAAADGRVSAQWRDQGIPQLLQYQAVEPPSVDSFPLLPDRLVENPPRLLRALVDAGESTDADAVRFAVNCIQLCSAPGSIGATDGRQLLVQSGFTFPWEGDVLIPRSKVFSSPELAGDDPIVVGRAGDWVAFRTGSWTVWLAVNKEGRFPDLSRHILRADDATARCHLSAADVEFLTQALPRLPSDDTFNHPITVDLNGSIAIRAKSADSRRTSELVLTNSTWSGEAMRLHMNRQYLARAAKLGFRELYVYSDKSPALCQDEHRQYVWALLAPDAAIPPASDAIRTESPRAETEVPVSKPTSKPKRRTIPVPTPVTNPSDHATPDSNGHANGKATKANGQVRSGVARTASQQDIAALIEQATRFRTALHNLTHEATGLVKSLKRHRRQSKAVQTTLASLKQLKSLGV